MQWLKYISFRKILNLIKVYVSFVLSNTFKKAIVWGYPYSLTTEPTNKCNLQCLECPTGNKTATSEKGEMSLDRYKQIINKVKNYTFFQMLYFQGEPFLNSSIFEFIEYSNHNKIYTSLSTNGHFLSKENCNKIIQSGLNEIIISLDGITPESYEKYRKGGNLNKVIEGIQTLAQEKKKLRTKLPKIILQFIVFKHNEHEIPQLKLLCKDLNVNKLELKSAQISNPENSNLIPNNTKYSRYSSNSPKPLIKNKLKNKCYRIWSTMVIRWNGKLIPCCFDKNNTYEIGNIFLENPFKLWRSSAYKEFRISILKNRKKVKICQNCTEGLNI